MNETLFHTYTPLILWIGLGLLLFRFVLIALPRLLGRTLYWVGVSMEILALACRTDFSEGTGLALAITIAALTTGLALSWISWQVGNPVFKSDSSLQLWLQKRSCKGSFILSAMLSQS